MLSVVVLTTGPLFDLATAKAHLHVDDGDQDELIEVYCDAAVLSALIYCDLKLVPAGAEPAFRAGALLMLGDLYANREAVTEGQTYSPNPTVKALLQPYRTIRV